MTTKTDQWQAVIADYDGYIYPDVSRDDPEPFDEIYTMSVKIVRGSATPLPEGNELRLPLVHAGDDLVASWDNFTTASEVLDRFEQAQAMAAGLNAAAKGTPGPTTRTAHG